MDKALKIMNGMQARKIELANVNDLNKATKELSADAIALTGLANRFQRVDMDLRGAEQKMQQEIADYTKRLQDQFDVSVKEHARLKDDIRSGAAAVKKVLVQVEKVTKEVEQTAKELGVPMPIPVKEAKQLTQRVDSLINNVTAYIK